MLEVAGVRVDPRHWIGGERVSSADTFDDLSPIDGTVLGQVARGQAAEVDAAVAAAREAFPAGPSSARAGAARSSAVSLTSSSSVSRNLPNSRPATTARCCARTAGVSCRALR